MPSLLEVKLRLLNGTHYTILILFLVNRIKLASVTFSKKYYINEDQLQLERKYATLKQKIIYRHKEICIIRNNTMRSVLASLM